MLKEERGSKEKFLSPRMLAHVQVGKEKPKCIARPPDLKEGKARASTVSLAYARERKVRKVVFSFRANERIPYEVAAVLTEKKEPEGSQIFGQKRARDPWRHKEKDNDPCTRRKRPDKQERT